MVNPTANTASLTLSNVTLLDSGNYTVRITNPLGSVTSSPATMVNVVPDTTAPTVTKVVGEADLITFVVTFSEPMEPTSVIDNFAYAIRATDNSEQLSLNQIQPAPNPTQIILVSTTPRNPAKSYNLIVNEDGQSGPLDACTMMNFIAQNTIVPIAPAFPVQDAELHSGGSAATPLGTNPTLTVDNDDGGIAQALLRFDNIFGNSPGQVPLGSVIVSATLTVSVFDLGSPVNMHRMLIPWTRPRLPGIPWSMGAGRRRGSQDGHRRDHSSPRQPASSRSTFRRAFRLANGAPNLAGHSCQPAVMV
jgi:hypothetical protein